MILGHVDSTEGPAVFFNLRSLVAGNKVNVTLADGIVAQFRVASIATYLKSNFPDHGCLHITRLQGRALQLVTCGRGLRYGNGPLPLQHRGVHVPGGPRSTPCPACHQVPIPYAGTYRSSTFGLSLMLRRPRCL